MGATQDIYFATEDVDGEPGSPVNITKTLLATPFTASTIIGYFDTEGMQKRDANVYVENSTPIMTVLTSDLGAAKAASFTIGGVVYYEAGREKSDAEVTRVNLSRTVT